jgi:hypothetical protein
MTTDPIPEKDQHMTTTTVSTPNYFCPKHGDQGGFIGISVTLTNGGDHPLPASLKPYVGTRNYCYCCWLDWMDANLCQLTDKTTP